MKARQHGTTWDDVLARMTMKMTGRAGRLVRLGKKLTTLVFGDPVCVSYGRYAA